jgi:hypothetical protein
MKNSRIAALALALVGVLSFFGAGCGHYHHSDYYVTTTAGTYETFSLTLVNNTNQTLLPGPILAAPYDPNVPAVAIPPGGSAVYSIGFLPSSITVGATGVGTFANYVYPTTTLELGVDYFSDATGATFVYH